ncbi:MAG: magnesium chelatase domain-containing protein, partial [Tumebacillaceae bacterium]
MYAQLNSLALYGLHGMVVRVELDITNGLPSFDLVGLPDSSVREAKDRVRAALRNSGYQLPLQRITANLAPAHVRKEGSGFDLCLALGILVADGKLPAKPLERMACVGELALDGTIRPVRGMLSLALAAREQGLHTLLVAPENAQEAVLINGLTILACPFLHDACRHLTGESPLTPYQPSLSASHDRTIRPDCTVDFSEIKGQPHVKRALEITAAG